MTCARTLATLLLLMLVCAPLTVRAGESITAAPTSATNDGANGGSANWNSSASTTPLASAARGVGGAFATASLDANKADGAQGVQSKYLYLSGFNFSIPADASIRGISVSLGRRAGVAGHVYDSEVRLVSQTVATPVNKAQATVAWGDTFSTATYGNSADLWGKVWTPAMINDASFGVLVSAYNSDLNSGHTARINSILVTVSYSLRATPIFTTQTYTLPLQNGWSLVSTPVVPEDAALADITASTSADAVWSYDPSDPAADGGWLLYTPAHPELSNLSTMQPGFGYFVHASTTSELSVTGALFAPDTPPPSRALSGGWNLIGSYAGAGEEIDDALASIGWAGLEYLSLWRLDPSSGAYKLPQAIFPGEAYWILLDAPHTYAPANF